MSEELKCMICGKIVDSWNEPHSALDCVDYLKNENVILHKRISELTIPADVLETLIDCVLFTMNSEMDNCQKALDWLKGQNGE